MTGARETPPTRDRRSDNPGETPPLPNFFVIGANRAGTTSLHEYLGQHPDVFMCPIKEPRFFAPKSRLDLEQWPDQRPAVTTIDEYRALFAGVDDERAIGESSTVYLSSTTAPGRIRDAVPDARLVAVLRNPIDRAFSDFSLHRSWGREPLSFADAVSAELDHGGPVAGRRRGYVGTGFYGPSLDRYLEYFDRDQLRVYLYEDLVADPNSLLRSIFEFLQVDPAIQVRTTARRNASRYEPRNRLVERAARARTVRSLARRLVPDRTWVRAREFVRRNNSVRPAFPEDVRRRLLALYREDIHRTAEIIGRDLSEWLR